MKAGLTILFLCASLTSFTQQPVFNKTYFHTAGDHANLVIACANGNSLIACNSNNTIRLMLTDPAGVLIWDKKGGSNRSMTSLIQTFDQGFMLSGILNNMPCITRLDLSGNNFGKGSTMCKPCPIITPFALRETSDTNYFFTVCGNDQLDPSAMVFKVDRVGDRQLTALPLSLITMAI